MPGVDFIEGDLADLAVAPPRGARAWITCSTRRPFPSVPRSVSDPITSNRANIDATLNVLVAARDAGVKRLVYAGSSSAYGDTPTLPKREEMPTNPLSPYALQKLVGEQYLAMFTQLYGLDTVTIRYFNVFGPRQDPVVAVLGRHLAVHQRARGRAPADHLRRRRADARLHLRGQRRGRRAARVPRARASAGRMMNVATGGPHQPERAAVHAVRPARREGDRRVPRAARRRRARFAGRHQPGEAASPATRRSWTCARGSRRRSRGTDRRSRRTE